MLKEVFLQSLELAEEQIVGLLDEHDGHIGYCGGRTGGDELHIIAGIAMFLAQTAHGFQLHRVFFPLALTMCLQIVFVIFQQFLEAGLGHIDELYLGLGRGGRGGTPFNDVLLAGTGSLHHLVEGAVCLGQIFAAKLNSDTVYDIGLLITPKVFVIASMSDQFFHFLFLKIKGLRGLRDFRDFN